MLVVSKQRFKPCWKCTVHLVTPPRFSSSMWWFSVPSPYQHTLPWLQQPRKKVLKCLQWQLKCACPKKTHVTCQFSSIAQSCRTLWRHGLRHARPPCPSPTPGVYSNSCPLSWWCHPTISFSVFPFFSHLQSFPASGSFQMSQLFASGGQSIGVSASISVLPMKTQDWSPLGWIGWISLQPKGLSKVFCNTTVQKHQFFGTQLSL